MPYGSLAEDGDPVGELERLRLVVGHVQGGEPEPVLHRQQLVAQLVTDLGVDVGQRLVEEDEVVALDDGTRERDALLLATTDLVRVLVCQLQDADLLQGRVDLLTDLRP